MIECSNQRVLKRLAIDRSPKLQFEGRDVAEKAGWDAGQRDVDAKADDDEFELAANAAPLRKNARELQRLARRQGVIGPFEAHGETGHLENPAGRRDTGCQGEYRRPGQTPDVADDVRKIQAAFRGVPAAAAPATA